MKTSVMRQAMKRRNAIEPVINHLKSNTRVGRNFLKGSLGDKIVHRVVKNPAPG